MKGYIWLSALCIVALVGCSKGSPTTAINSPSNNSTASPDSTTQADTTSGTTTPGTDTAGTTTSGAPSNVITPTSPNKNSAMMGQKGMKPNSPTKQPLILGKPSGPLTMMSSPASGPGSYLIRLHPSNGQMVNYKVINSAIVPTPTGQMPINSSMLLAVTYKPSSKGNISESTRIKDVDYSKVIQMIQKQAGPQAAQIIPQIKKQLVAIKKVTLTSVLNPENEVVTKASATGNSPLASMLTGSSPGGQATIISFSHSPVKIGSTWPFSMGRMVGTCKLISVKTIGNKKYGLIQLQSGVKGFAGSKTTGTVLIDLSSGVMREAHLTSDASANGKSAHSSVDITQQ